MFFRMIYSLMIFVSGLSLLGASPSYSGECLDLLTSGAASSLDEILRSGKILKIEPLKTHPTKQLYLLELENGIKAVFKPKKLTPPVFRPNKDMAVYIISTIFDLNLVPATTVRTIEGYGEGMVQRYIEGLKAIKKTEIPYSRDLNVLDFLIANGDRGPNYFMTPEKKEIAIDHDWSFDEVFWNLFQIEREALFADPMNFYPNINSMQLLRKVTDSELIQALSPWLTMDEIRFFLSRRLELLKIIDQHQAVQIQKQNEHLDKRKIQRVFKEHHLEAETFFSPYRDRAPVIDVYAPKTRGGSGDWLLFNSVEAPQSGDKMLAITLGDISGHGLSKMDYALKIQDRVSQQKIHYGLAPEQVVFNSESEIRKVLDQAGGELFTSMAQLHFYPKTGELEYAHAGPLYLFLKKKNGSFVPLLGKGGFIGSIFDLQNNSSLTTRKVQLEPGDTVILTTDGFMEARVTRISTDRELGTEVGTRGSLFDRVMTSLPTNDPQKIIEVIQRMAAHPDDDLSLIVFRYDGP